MPVALANIRSELLPGLFDVRGSYDMIPRQWDKVFTTHKSNMAVERSTQMAFVALPPIEDFLAARFSKEFRAREAFESWADQCHDALLVARGIDEGEHIQHHQRHLQAFVRARHERDATQEELVDVKQMLLCRGVAPAVPASAMARQAAGCGPSLRAFGPPSRQWVVKARREEGE